MASAEGSFRTVLQISIIPVDLVLSMHSPTCHTGGMSGCRNFLSLSLHVHMPGCSSDNSPSSSAERFCTAVCQNQNVIFQQNICHIQNGFFIHNLWIIASHHVDNAKYIPLLSMAFASGIRLPPYFFERYSTEKPTSASTS